MLMEIHRMHNFFFFWKMVFVYILYSKYFAQDLSAKWVNFWKTPICTFPLKKYFILENSWFIKGLPRWLSGKESTCQCRRYRRCGFDPKVRKIPWRRKWWPTPVFLHGESIWQMSLAGYISWGSRVGHDWACMYTMIYNAYMIYNVVLVSGVQ